MGAGSLVAGGDEAQVGQVLARAAEVGAFTVDDPAEVVELGGCGRGPGLFSEQGFDDFPAVGEAADASAFEMDHALGADQAKVFGFGSDEAG